LTIKKHYDIVVVGGGPAGSVAAERAAKAGMRVLLCEKRDVVGVPVRCAELSGFPSEIAQFILPDPAFIANQITGCRLHSPAGRVYTADIPEPALMLDRAKFDQALFENAARAGAHTVTGTVATALDFGKNSHVKVVFLERAGKRQKVNCDFLIGADGVESTVGRMLGIRTLCPLHEIYSCLQVRLDRCDAADGRISFYVGSRTAPGGYLWVFPREDGTANVGVALIRPAGAAAPGPRQCLDAFLSSRFPRAKVLARVAGGIPLDGGLKQHVQGNAVLIGDAAHHANPFSGGGIMNSMEDADLFVDTLLSLIQDKKAHSLAPYRKIYYRKYGRLLKWQRLARKVFYSLEDNHVERLFTMMDGMLKDRKFDLPQFQRALIWSWLRMSPVIFMRLRKIFG
jgi:digeranylgeranylglycerophospholipid reductase